MKKALLVIVMMMGALGIHASDYSYLTFETTDGSKVSVSVSGLSITISGTTLTAGSQSFTLTNLSKMYFSTADETTGSGEATDIAGTKTAGVSEGAEIYDLRGKKVGKNQMRRGVYIVKTKNGTSKINVK